MSIDSKKIVRGSVYYSLRILFVAALVFSTNIFILSWISPSEIGYFATVNLVFGLIGIFSEGGLSVYLIQRKKDISDKDLCEVGALQLLVYFLIHVLVFCVLLSGIINESNHKLLTYIFIILFCIPAGIIRSNSFVKLERELLFGKIAVIEIIESLFFASCSLIFAYIGLGVWSLILGMLIKVCVGSVIAYNYSGWKFRLIFPNDINQLKVGLKFGINYHIPTFVTALRSSVNPILIGGVLGIAAVGIIDRAIYIAGLPLFILGTVQQRVLFPYFAKIQNQNDLLCAHFEKSFYISAIIDKIFYIPLVLFCGNLINLLLPKWSELVPVIYIAVIGNIIFGAISFSMIPVLNGIGRANIFARFSILTMLVTWLISWPFVKYLGVNGYAIVTLIVWIIGIIPGVYIIKKYLPYASIRNAMFFPLFSFCLSILIAWFCISDFVGIDLSEMILFSILTILLYFIILAFLDGHNIRKIFSKLLTTYKS